MLTDPLLVEQSLKASDPHVITLDMDMPGRNGLAVLEELGTRVWTSAFIISGNPRLSARPVRKSDCYT